MNIPNMDFRGQKFVNEDGTLTEPAQMFLDNLNSVLMKNAGNEGLVSPSQTTSNIAVIAANKQISSTGVQSYTCQFGTFIYDTVLNKVFVSLSNAGVPQFHEVKTV